MELQQILSSAVTNTISIGETEQSSSTLISDSNISEYVPFFTAFQALFKVVGGRRFSIYNIPNESCSLRIVPTNKLLHFIAAMSEACKPMPFIKNGIVYQIMKQCIFQYNSTGDPVLLYTLAFRSKYLFGDNVVNMNNLDYSQLVILVSRNFEAPDNRLMYNLVKREIITPLVDLGLDLVMTNSIENWCFKSAAETISFATLAETRGFLSNLNNEIIDEITGRRRLPETARVESAEIPTEFSTETPDSPGTPLQRPIPDGRGILIQMEEHQQSTATGPGINPQTFTVRFNEGDFQGTNSGVLEVPREQWESLPGWGEPTSAGTPTGETADLLRSIQTDDSGTESGAELRGSPLSTNEDERGISSTEDGGIGYLESLIREEYDAEVARVMETGETTGLLQQIQREDSTFVERAREAARDILGFPENPNAGIRRGAHRLDNTTLTAIYYGAAPDRSIRLEEPYRAAGIDPYRTDQSSEEGEMPGSEEQSEGI